MNIDIAALGKAWRQRPPREKWLIACTSVAALLVAGDGLLTAPLEKRLKQARQQTQALQTRWQALQTQAVPATPALAELRVQEKALRERLQAAQAAAAALRQQLASSARLPETLRAITATVEAVRLLELNLAGAAESAAAAPAASAGGAGQHLYRLPITLKVSGSWDQLQALLVQIERHAESLQWSAFTLDAAHWPEIELTLQAHVLSLDPRWGAAS